MKIYKFNINDDRDKVMSDLIEVYKNHMELFEDEAYCHFNIDKDNVTVFNKTRESEYSCACAYETDECGWVYDDEIKDCVEYFYDEIMEVADCRYWFK